MDDKKQSSTDDQKKEPVEQPKEVELKEEKKGEEEDYKSKYLRALADYHNLERRVRDERAEITKIAQAHLIEELLPFLDTLYQAEVFIKDPGLKMVKDTFLKTLEQMGVKEIELFNKEYDPHTAEAIEVVEGEKDNIVVEVLRRAYEFKGKVIRIGQVKVSKKVN